MIPVLKSPMGMEVRQEKSSTSYFNDKPINTYINERVSSRALNQYGYEQVYLKINQIKPYPVLPSYPIQVWDYRK